MSADSSVRDFLLLQTLNKKTCTLEARVDYTSHMIPVWLLYDPHMTLRATYRILREPLCDPYTTPAGPHVTPSKDF